jgi:prepilin-type N-terminal cleavage/methylation domain-containing protein
MSRRRQRAAFSLIEILLVISIMAIVAGLVLPSADPSIHDQLQSAARIVAADLAYARSLAVTHNSSYRIDFELAENRYVLRHSGAEAALDVLPDTSWRNPDDRPDEHVVDLDELPHMGIAAEIAAVAEGGSLLRAVDYVEFGPLGEVTRSAYTIIWLVGGQGRSRRYVAVYVNPVSGLATIGSYTAEPPPEAVTAQSN